MRRAIIKGMTVYNFPAHLVEKMWPESPKVFEGRDEKMCHGFS